MFAVFHALLMLTFIRTYSYWYLSFTREICSTHWIDHYQDCTIKNKIKIPVAFREFWPVVDEIPNETAFICRLELLSVADSILTNYIEVAMGQFQNIKILNWLRGLGNERNYLFCPQPLQFLLFHSLEPQSQGRILAYSLGFPYSLTITSLRRSRYLGCHANSDCKGDHCSLLVWENRGSAKIPSTAWGSYSQSKNCIK